MTPTMHTLPSTKPGASAVLLFAAMVLGACASTKVGRQSEGPVVRPSSIRLTPEQAQARGGADAGALAVAGGRRFAAEDADSVVASADVKAYSIGRYVAPADPGMLHEAHVVYRREAGPRGRLDAPASRQILVGPSITARAPFEPLRSDELEATIASLRRSQRENQEALRMLTTAVEALARNQETVVRMSADAARAAGGVRTGKDKTERKTGTDKTIRSTSRGVAPVDPVLEATDRAKAPESIF